MQVNSWAKNKPSVLNFFMNDIQWITRELLLLTLTDCCFLLFKVLIYAIYSWRVKLNIFIRSSFVKLSKSSTMVLNGDTGFQLLIIGISFVRYKRQMIELRIHAFILIWLTRERPCRRHSVICIFVSRTLLILRMNYFWTLELWMKNVINCYSVSRKFQYQYNTIQYNTLLEFEVLYTIIHISPIMFYS